MTAPTIKRNAAKKSLISGRRPDKTMPVNGTLKEMVETTYDRRRSGLASGYIQELETSIEVDMLQIQALWHQLGLPV
jgi:hypothetical protein